MVKTSPFHGGNMGSNPVGVTTSWGYSSAGRARALQARGHRFEPCCPHHIKKRATLCVVLFLCVGKQHRARIRRVIRLCANHCAPVPRSHCTLALKCKHFRFAVDEPCCPRVAHFAFEVTLSLAIMLALLLACSFSPKVQSIFWGPHILKKRIKMMCCFCCMGHFMGENPTERLAVGGCLQTLALCTVSNFADTLRRFAVYPRFALCRARPVVPASHTSLLKSHYRSR